MKARLSWQTTVGADLDGKTLGLIGIGRLGSKFSTIAKAFDMSVLPDLTTITG